MELTRKQRDLNDINNLAAHDRLSYLIENQSKLFSNSKEFLEREDLSHAREAFNAVIHTCLLRARAISVQEIVNGEPFVASAQAAVTCVACQNAHFAYQRLNKLGNFAN